MGKSLDLTGKRFGRFTVVKLESTRPRNPVGTCKYWECLCDCGNVRIVRASDLTQGKSKSCGCYRQEVVTLHGDWENRLYTIWAGIKQRCCNEKEKNYWRYGGAGINMEKQWEDDYRSFREYIGYPPSKSHTIDRIDNRKGYVKGNIRWATWKQQSRNKGMLSNNTSGATGVGLRCIRGNYYYVAYWVDNMGISRCTSFPVNRYGEDLAFSMACNRREEEILKLNELDNAEYNENHGKPNYNSKLCQVDL